MSQATCTPKGASHCTSLRRCCSAKISVGAIRAHCQPASMQLHAASAATTVLPDPTSPCSSRCMGTWRAKSAAISCPTRSWAGVSSKGNAASSWVCRAALFEFDEFGEDAIDGALNASRSRRAMCCDNCCANNSSAFRRCHAGWVRSSSSCSAAPGVGWCSTCKALCKFSMLGLTNFRLAKACGARVSDTSARPRPANTALRR